MKKATYITSVATIAALLLGVSFKINHWPGATAMINLGLVGFSLIALPLMSIHLYTRR